MTNNKNDLLSDSEIDSHLEQAEQSEPAYHVKQATQDTGLEQYSADQLTLEPIKEETLECLNCAAPLQGPYCHNCGQPDRHFIRFFPKVLWEMINEAFDLDSRIGRTLIPLLLRPGRLSMEYIAGRRARYVNPLRLYIILSLVFFVSISLFTSTPDNINTTGSDGVNLTIASDADVELDESNKNKNNDNSGLFNDDGSSNISFENAKKWDLKTNPILFHGLFNQETTNELNSYLWNMALKLDKAIKDDPSDLFDEFLNAIPQLMFILLPIFALLLKVTYIFKKRYYMEHLIVALHSHCFIFFSLILIILVNALEVLIVGPVWLIDSLDWFSIALAIWIPVNIFLTQKRIYAQGYFMTFVKFVFVGWLYTVLLSFTAILAFAVGLATL